MKTVTLGMFAVGFLITVVRIAHWWIKSGKGKNWKDLLPFLGSASAFALAGACAGGLVGTVVTWARNMLGGAGDYLLIHGTGAQHVAVTRSADFGVLNPFGAVIMLGAVAVLAVVVKSAKDRLKREVGWAGAAGITLGPFLGAVALVPLVNGLGTAAIGRWF